MTIEGTIDVCPSRGTTMSDRVTETRPTTKIKGICHPEIKGRLFSRVCVIKSLSRILELHFIVYFKTFDLIIL